METNESYLNNKHLMSVMRKMTRVYQKTRKPQFSLASSNCYRDKNGILHINQKYNHERELIEDDLDDIKQNANSADYQFSKEQLIDYLTFSAAQFDIFSPEAKVLIENYDEQSMTAKSWPIILSLVENGTSLYQLRITPFLASQSTKNSKLAADEKTLSKIAAYCYGKYGEAYRKDYCVSVIARAKRSVIYGYSSLTNASSKLNHELSIINMMSDNYTKLITMPLQKFDFDYHVIDRNVSRLNSISATQLASDYDHMLAVKRKLDRCTEKEIVSPYKHYYYNEDGIFCVEDNRLSPTAVNYMLKEAGELNALNEEENSK